VGVGNRIGRLPTFVVLGVEDLGGGSSVGARSPDGHGTATAGDQVTQVPALFPPVLPAWRTPVWYAIALVTGVLAALVMLRPRTPRAVLFGLGWLQVLLAFVNGFLVGDIAALLVASWLAVSALALHADRSE